ncbi:hypothetical protein [Rhodopirellula sp. UBA1907]|uniref:hypothetical protein n=1 Tax=Rhodopirellula sp. UBA1907 TaxID=1947381 RepID=UPI00257E9530|nr:hypothetical protein [Rhodopirellula sp. UBA1907]
MLTVNRHTFSRCTQSSFFGMSSLMCVAALGFAVASFASPSTASAGGEEAVVNGLFEAMEAGTVEAKFIPQSSAKANLLVKNLTDKPLHIHVPAAFAGVPVLAQGMMGGGMGGMGGGMGGMGGGMGGFMRVAPGRTSKMALNTVCLEHGKPEPNAKMKYTIAPLDQVTKDPAVAALCEALGNGVIAQNTAQAAAWHLTDDMSWNELAEKNRKESQYTGNEPYFTSFELRAASNVVGEVKRIAQNYQDKLESAEKTEGGLTLDNSYGS